MKQQVNQPGSTPQSLIRNFCIIAHIDHGKSTVADRILQLSGVVDAHDMRNQFLDKMDIERERGITIKSQAVRVPWAVDGTEYTLGMIDTPGHVDFTYEVSRSLAACEGAVLLVDATQGIEAQTLSNLYMALDDDLEIIPVLNKIDLPSAEPEKYGEEIANLIGCDPDDILRVSGKTGEGIPELLDTIVKKIPAPHGDPDAPARALIFDSVYDSYRGIVTYIRMEDGEIHSRERVRQMGLGSAHDPIELGVISPDMQPTQSLGAGEVGYIITGVKDVSQSKVGDTITTEKNPATEVLPGYREPEPMVYAGIFPMDNVDYPDLRDALDKLVLNDASLVYQPETSVALGFGFRCGFLGLLHMQIIVERLRREFGLELITTAPNVHYRVIAEDSSEITVTNPSEYPEGKIRAVYEPVADADIITPKEFVGDVMDLCQEHRGNMKNMEYLSTERVDLHYELPLGEIVFDFFDQLKSRTKGYATLNYELSGEQEADLVKVDILIQGERVDAFSAIVHRDKAYAYGVMMTKKLQKLIPRQLFEIPLQAAIGARIIARETISALRKDVLAKCYGGDITRKRKLLEKQKAGKKKMKMLGRVEVPQEAFIAALSTDDTTDRDTREKIRAAKKKASL
ncbi:translation elongation factor 4 [Aeriscardovia aeriphila]|uniref:Elongation factor 4 n=1 Tax=Aeriscardovia aeriphila TaxID=218139 RepID=A0A261FA59_9BIFI|nr:translation elongation factor 4 [Aeriscardovia aeriphila]NYI25877.1 GTP-binding protein LepA [Aeriscardovia aeriphila]OZG55974.1 elongation factor 4 [Aeriscardovia aeriphila]